MNTLPRAELIEVVEVEPLDVLLKQDLTLLQLALEALSIPSWSESLPVSVLLMTWSTSIGASGASWMFRVALGYISISKLRCRWKLPPVASGVTALAFIFLLLHRAHAS